MMVYPSHFGTFTQKLRNGGSQVDIIASFLERPIGLCQSLLFRENVTNFFAASAKLANPGAKSLVSSTEVPWMTNGGVISIKTMRPPGRVTRIASRRKAGQSRI